MTHATALRRTESGVLFQAFVALVVMFGIWCMPRMVAAAAPTASTASLENYDTTYVTVLINGTDFSYFVNSVSTTADPDDLVAINYAGSNPMDAVITSPTLITAHFEILSTTTGKLGGALTIDSGTVYSSSDEGNDPISIANGSITDNADPFVFPDQAYGYEAWYEDTNTNGTIDRVTVNFSESVSTSTYADADWTIPTAGSVVVLGDDSAGTVSFGYFQLTVAGAAGKTGGGTSPTVQYVNNASNLKDAANNPVASFGPLTIQDGAAPYVTDAQVSIAGGSGTGGAYIVGDTITVTWDTTTLGDSLSSAYADLSYWGDVSYPTMTDTTDCLGTSANSVYEACYTITGSENVDSTGYAGIEAYDANTNSAGVIYDGTLATIDTVVPAVTDTNISVTDSNGGTFVTGDVVTVIWDNSTATGDDNADIYAAAADLSGWGGAGAVSMTDTSACSGDAGDDIYEACYTLVSGAIDTTGVDTSVSVLDDAGNGTTTPHDTNATVDTTGGGGDVTSPTVFAAGTRDGDGDGKIDSIIVVYDEAVNDANYDAVAASGYTMSGTGSGSGTTDFIYNLVEGGSADTGATPSLTWTAANAADTSANLLNTAGAPATAEDDADPVLLSFTSSTANGTYGPPDDVNVTANYSETLASGSITVSLNNTVTGLALATLSTNTLSGTYAVGATGSGQDVANLHVSAITAHSVSDGSNTDTSTDLPATVIANGITIDVTAPTVTDANITVSGATGTSGKFKLGDVMVIEWDNSVATGDGNTDVVSAGAASYWSGAMADDTSCSGTAGDDIWRACHTIIAGDAIDGIDQGSVSATDAVTNASSYVNDGATLTIDSIVPVVTDANITVSGASGTGGAYRANDLVVVTWDNSTATGDDNGDLASATADLSGWGGSATTTMADTTACTGTAGDDIYEACYMTDGTEGIDDTGITASVTATDDAGNVTTTSDTTGATVDTVAPPVDGLQMSVSGASGSLGTFVAGDIVSISWDSSVVSDFDNATADLSPWGGSASAAFTDTTNCGGTDSDGVYEVCFELATGTIDSFDNDVEATVYDDANNAEIMTRGTYDIDTQVPVVTDANIVVSGATGTGGAHRVGDIVTVTWDNSAATGDDNGDISGASAELSGWGGSAAAAMTDTTDCGGTDGDDIWEACYEIDGTEGIDDTGVSAQVTVTDDAGQQVYDIDSATATIDTIRPTFSSATVYDMDSNGGLDRIVFILSEPLANTASGTNGFDVISLLDHGSCNGESVDPTASTTLNLIFTCSIGRTDIADLIVESLPSSGVVDDAGNSVANTYYFEAISTLPLVDAADPVLLSTTPADAATGVSRSANFSLSFSEPMDEADVEARVSLTPASGTLAFTWDAESMTLTVNPSAQLAATTVYDLDLSSGADSADLDDGMMGAEAISFTSAAASSGGGGGGGGGGGVSAPYVSSEISLTAPSGTIVGGTVATVQWTQAGTEAQSVYLEMAVGGGAYQMIAQNLPKDAPYQWSVPAELSGAVTLRAQLRNSAGSSLMTSSVTVTAIAASAVLPQDIVLPTDAELGIIVDSSGRRVAPLTDATGVSPLTLQPEAISQVRAGQFIRGYGYDAVYYVAPDMTRRPFTSATVFRTWTSSFGNVVWVTDATLSSLRLGPPMMPKPGVVLVKIQSDNRTYETMQGAGTTHLLRWIVSEPVARGRFGLRWADYVIDIPATLFGMYVAGPDQTSTEPADMSGMKTRMQLTGATAS